MKEQRQPCFLLIVELGRLPRAPPFDQLLERHVSNNSHFSRSIFFFFLSSCFVILFSDSFQKQYRFARAEWVLGLIPVAIVLAILSYTYYVVVVLTLLPPFLPPSSPPSILPSPSPSPSPSVSSYSSPPAPVAGVFLVVYHVAFLLCLWSYFTTVWTDPGHIPLWFILSETIKEATQVFFFLTFKTILSLNDT